LRSTPPSTNAAGRRSPFLRPAPAAPDNPARRSLDDQFDPPHKIDAARADIMSCTALDIIGQLPARPRARFARPSGGLDVASA